MICPQCQQKCNHIVGILGGSKMMCAWCWHQGELPYPEIVDEVGAYKYADDKWLLVSKACAKNGIWYAWFNTDETREYKELNDYFKVHGKHIIFGVKRSHRRGEYGR